jgi:hypothetical protein
VLNHLVRYWYLVLALFGLGSFNRPCCINSLFITWFMLSNRQNARHSFVSAFTCVYSVFISIFDAWWLSTSSFFYILQLVLLLTVPVLAVYNFLWFLLVLDFIIVSHYFIFVTITLFCPYVTNLGLLFPCAFLSLRYGFPVLNPLRL